MYTSQTQSQTRVTIRSNANHNFELSSTTHDNQANMSIEQRCSTHNSWTYIAKGFRVLDTVSILILQLF